MTRSPRRPPRPSPSRTRRCAARPRPRRPTTAASAPWTTTAAAGRRWARRRRARGGRGSVVRLDWIHARVQLEFGRYAYLPNNMRLHICITLARTIKRHDTTRHSFDLPPGFTPTYQQAHRPVKHAQRYQVRRARWTCQASTAPPTQDSAPTPTPPRNLLRSAPLRPSSPRAALPLCGNRRSLKADEKPTTIQSRHVAISSPRDSPYPPRMACFPQSRLPAPTRHPIQPPASAANAKSHHHHKWHHGG
ncbi:hypothetical protein B0T18DRAFT_88590 [Schizothecium vesticola]|uniref:Uncharacterized protein n=1 Tax=Schizothecium vesticola TaxID=314040 RepID=A0AA40F709_9PEZI|nr:hypothetical protein B0T18DRAFT_88590 [Schizothecium vesticola]